MPVDGAVDAPHGLIWKGFFTAFRKKRLCELQSQHCEHQNNTLWFFACPKCSTWVSATVQAGIGGFRNSLFFMGFLVTECCINSIFYAQIELFIFMTITLTKLPLKSLIDALVITPRWQNVRLPRRASGMAGYSLLCLLGTSDNEC